MQPAARKRRSQSVLTKLQKELGITFVYVAHGQSEAFAMADCVVIMAQGEIAQVGKGRTASNVAVETPPGLFDVRAACAPSAKPGDPLSFVGAIQNSAGRRSDRSC